MSKYFERLKKVILAELVSTEMLSTVQTSTSVDVASLNLYEDVPNQMLHSPRLSRMTGLELAVLPV